MNLIDLNDASVKWNNIYITTIMLLMIMRKC